MIKRVDTFDTSEGVRLFDAPDGSLVYFDEHQREMKKLTDALRTIADQAGPYAAKQPALDYATIANVARKALASAGDIT